MRIQGCARLSPRGEQKIKLILVRIQRVEGLEFGLDARMEAE